MTKYLVSGDNGVFHRLRFIAKVPTIIIVIFGYERDLCRKETYLEGVNCLEKSAEVILGLRAQFYISIPMHYVEQLTKKIMAGRGEGLQVLSNQRGAEAC